MRAFHCLQRPIAAAILFLTCALALTGCSTDATAEKSGMPEGAQKVLDSALETMFSWRPAFDASPGAALQRATIYVTPEVVPQLIDLQDEMPKDWALWKEKRATVTPSFYFSGVPGADDNYTQHKRWVTVTQTVRDINGQFLGDFRFTLRPVVVSFTNGEWLISEISGIDEAGGGICPRDPDNECRTPQRDTTTTAAPATTTTAPR